MRLIDADAAYEKIMRDVETHADEIGIGGMALMIAFARAMRDETDFPTVDSEPVRHCRWIQKYQPPDPKASWSTEYYCSGCGHETHMTVMPDQRDNYIDDYCGGCGARMDAEDINVLTKDGGADNG